MANKQFRCYRCGEKFDLFKDIIDHNIKLHPQESLKIRMLSLDCTTGSKIYISKDFHIQPSDIIGQGKSISVNDNDKIIISSPEVSVTNETEPSNEDNNTTAQESC